MDCDIATCMYYTGMDPFTKKQVFIARNLRDRKLQRALMQFFKPENWFIVREALIQAGRQDLIGSGCDCPVPAQPPKEALEKRRREANRVVEGDHYHTVANPAKGERPGERGLPNADGTALSAGCLRYAGASLRWRIAMARFVECHSAQMKGAEPSRRISGVIGRRPVEYSHGITKCPAAGPRRLQRCRPNVLSGSGSYRE